MVSSSTYQIYITLFADSRDEATSNGLLQARKRALELILNEPFIYMRISDYGRQQLVKLIEEHGRIVMLEKLQDNSWGLVFHVQKQGLRSFFQMIH